MRGEVYDTRLKIVTAIGNSTAIGNIAIIGNSSVYIVYFVVYSDQSFQ